MADSRHGGRTEPTVGRKLNGAGKRVSGGPAEVESASGGRSSRDPSKRPADYPDELLWQMAEEFERQAMSCRVYLRGNVPYIYKALAQSVDRFGIRELERLDGNSRLVKAPELGVRLVQFFWDRAPWDREGDVITQFTNPMMFRDCLREMLRSWASHRSSERIKARIAAGIEHEPYVRVPKPALGYKTLGGN